MTRKTKTSHSLPLAERIPVKYQTMGLLVIPLLLLALLVAILHKSLYTHIFTALCINLVMVTSLQAFMGNGGILNWTHIGFMGIGAYASGIFSMTPEIKAMAAPNMYEFLRPITLHPLLAILLAGLVAALIAALISYPLMRLSDAVGVITIYAMLIIIHVVMTQWDNVTNGPRTFFGLKAYTTMPLALIFAALVIVLTVFFKHSALGLKLRATRDDRYAAMSIGIGIVKTRYLSFIFSALLAGIGGGLWAHFITSFSPKSFYITDFFSFLSMLVIGGTASVSGAVAGTTMVTVIRELLRQLESQLNGLDLGVEFFGTTEITLAIFMIIILALRPDGILKGREISLKTFSRSKKK